MEINATNLCDLSGIDVVDLMLEKISKPDLPLRIGNTVLGRIMSIEHHGDGMPVYTVQTGDDEVLVFQFEPGHEPFGETVMGQDGVPLCHQASESE